MFQSDNKEKSLFDQKIVLFMLATKSPIKGDTPTSVDNKDDLGDQHCAMNDSLNDNAIFVDTFLHDFFFLSF